MEKAKCRMCGAQFVPCKGIAGIPPQQQPFNWRTICCSVSCGSQFINSVLASRGLANDGTPVEDDTAPAPPEPAQKPRRQATKKTKQEPVEAESVDAAAEDTE